MTQEAELKSGTKKEAAAKVCARLVKAISQMRKGQRLTALEFSARVTDTAPTDGGIGAPGLPDGVRDAFLKMAVSKDVQQMNLSDGLVAEPLQIFENEDSIVPLFEAESVAIERLRLRREDKKGDSFTPRVTWLDFVLRLLGDDAQAWAGQRRVGTWVWLRIK